MYARRLHLGLREGRIRLGQSKSRLVLVVVVEKRVYEGASAWDRKGNEGSCILGLQRNQREYLRLRARVYEENLLVLVYETGMYNGYPQIIERP